MLLLGAMIGALALAGCERGQAQEPQQQQPATAVEIATVATADLEERVRGIGTLRAAATVPIRPEVAGIVRSIGFEEGGDVEQGQVLFEIHDEKLRAQLAARQAGLAAARARLATAQRNFDRIEQLTERRAVSQDEVDRARSGLDEALAEVQRTDAEVALVVEQLRDTRIRAPFAGVMAERLVDPGSYVEVGRLLGTLYRISDLEIEFTLPERFIGRVHRGQPVQVMVAAYPDSFEGTTSFVSPVVNEATRDFLVKAVIPNRQQRLKPGAFATAVVTIDVRPQRPVIPEEALVATREGYMVFAVANDVVEQRPVRVGLRDGGRVEVLEGLRPGEVIVRAGHMRLSSGDRVRIVGGGRSGYAGEAAEEEKSVAAGQ